MLVAQVLMPLGLVQVQVLVRPMLRVPPAPVPQLALGLAGRGLRAPAVARPGLVAAREGLLEHRTAAVASASSWGNTACRSWVVRWHWGFCGT